MDYYINRLLPVAFDEAVTRTKEALKQEGFGVLTEINVRETLKAKIGIDYPRYVILGACNPALAHEALRLENKVGTMLPCNVVVRDAGMGRPKWRRLIPSLRCWRSTIRRSRKPPRSCAPNSAEWSRAFECDRT